MHRSAALFVCTLAAAASAHGADGSCAARSAPLRVVELYTSEGCSSCPPADRWLSSVHRRDDVLALAFHVDYWDRLGWKDRFASPAHTERQYRLQGSTGARFVYTPQVLVDGVDWRRWPELPPVAAAKVDIELRRDGVGVEAQVSARDDAPDRLAGYWVSFEHAHVSDVRAGENTGARLQHDAVVRGYRELPAWPGREPRRLRFDGAPRVAERPGGVALVIVDARTQRPVGAAQLRC
jgi:hypothetical protein